MTSREIKFLVFRFSHPVIGHCNEEPCESEPLGQSSGTYETIYRQFTANGGIPAEWMHMHCMANDCDYYGNNGDEMLFSHLSSYNSPGFYRLRLHWSTGDSIEWSQNQAGFGNETRWKNFQQYLKDNLFLKDG